MRTIIALVALTAVAGSATAQSGQCRFVALSVSTAEPIVDLSPGAHAVVTICITSPNNGSIDIYADGNLKMRRNYQGNCGTVSGRQIAIGSRGGGTVTVSYCLEATALRPQ
jgi:hypothetical protein